ncbi:hypothetical protein BY458DRAFT_523034 [Sporodiniella umbellata]|nr:hypothetical protein BY458DRAFT_523034 [Sporodiniella umbellata]
MKHNFLCVLCISLCAAVMQYLKNNQRGVNLHTRYQNIVTPTRLACINIVSFLFEKVVIEPKMFSNNALFLLKS